jgi:hypothetical protein
LYVRYGAPVIMSTNGAQIVDHYAAAHPSQFVAVANGTPDHAPQPGDVISLSGNSQFSDTGHTQVVAASTVDANGNGTVSVVQQNAGSTGTAAYAVRNWVMPGMYGYSYVKWLHARMPLSYALTGQQIYAAAGASDQPVSAAAAASGSWLGETGSISVTVRNTGTDTWGPGYDNVRIGVANPSGSSQLYSSTGLTPAWLSSNRPEAVNSVVVPGASYTFSFGFRLDAPGAPVYSVVEHFNLVDEMVAWFPDNGPTFTFGIAKVVDRGVALLHGRANAGYTVDPDGTVHAFGGAKQPTDFATWPGFDIARGIVVRPDNVSGYVLDGWGGLHPFGGAPAVTVTAYWSGWDIARAITLTSDNGGYVLDGYGGLHPFGSAPAVASSAYWSGWDIARGLAMTDAGGGYILDGFGGIHPFGDAPATSVQSGSYTSGWDKAKGVAVNGGLTGQLVDGFGNLYSFATPLGCRTCS